MSSLVGLLVDCLAEISVLEVSVFICMTLIEYVNTNYSVVELYQKLKGTTVPTSGKVLCPFHANTNTPAAKIYRDSNILKCFGACSRSNTVYTPYDFLKKFFPEELSEIKKQFVFTAPKESIKRFKININREDCVKQGVSLYQALKLIKDKVDEALHV